MLIKATNSCALGCTHCMEGSVPGEPHMTADVYARALDFTERAERLAWQLGCLPIVLLSGGECTEHPDIVAMVESIVDRGWIPTLITNGMWLSNRELRAALLRPEWTTLRVQVTNDTRYYPQAPAERVNDPRIVYIESIYHVLPLGRAARKHFDAAGAPRRTAPTSFNLRSATRWLRSFEEAIATLRMRAALGGSGHCHPSVTSEGDVVAGESRYCWKIGTVDSSNEDLTRALLEMGSCNRCGLEANLTPPQRRAVGLSTLYGADE